MANNGMTVKISKEQFKAMETDDKLWLLFSGIENINQTGCSFAQRHLKAEKHLKLKMIGIGFAISLPLIYIILKLFVPGLP